jgi:exopolysaccharide biosynthesis polyprenyl glycosylphosphotransferase
VGVRASRQGGFSDTGRGKRAGLPLSRRRGWLLRRLLLGADIVGLSLAFVIAQLAYGLGAGPVDTVVIQAELLLFVVALPAWVVAAKLYGLYERDGERLDHSTVDDIGGVFHMVTVGAWLLVAGAWLTKLARPDFTKLIVFWALAMMLVLGGRAVARGIGRRTSAFVQNAIIVGVCPTGELLARKISSHPEYGINVVGFVDGDGDGDGGRADGARAHTDPTVLGPVSALPALIATHGVERVLVAFPSESDERTLELVRALKDHDVDVDIVPRLSEIVFPEVRVHAVAGLPLIGLPRLGLSRSSALLKRAVDVMGSAAGLVVLSPLLAVVALIIKLDSKGPVFFRQIRMGRGGSTFRIYKFRTMVADADERKAEAAHLNMHANGDARMFKVPEDPRITRVGRRLRRYSLDELPQLINVLKGEMSLVGPRPLILPEAQHVESWARRRMDLRPGITGLWQVLGRSEIPFREMTALDYRYVTSWSLWNDIRLLFQTLPAVLRKRGAY